MTSPDQADDELAREIGGRLVPEIGDDQIIPAAAVFDALGGQETGPAEPTDGTTGE